MFVIFDVADTMLFSSHDKLKCEYAAEMIYVLADAINKSGDSVGMGMFTDHYLNTVMPNIGAAVIKNIKSNLLNKDNYGGIFDFKKCLLMTRSLLNSKAVLIIVSDFLGMGEGWEQYVKMLSGDFELIAMMIRDPRDRTLPDSGGQFMLKDPVSGKNIYIDVDQYKELFDSYVLEQEKHIEEVFKRNKGDFLRLVTDEDYLQKIISFFQRRSKRQD